jgi:hypothetical protein
VILQIDTRWSKQFVRPPLDKDGNRIENADALKNAHDPDSDSWFLTACHVVSFVMLIDWLQNTNPQTKGKLIVPNLDLSKEITPPHVAFALFRTFALSENLPTDAPTSADQTKFVSATDHPPYVPFKKSGKSWQVLHKQITQDFQQLKLKTDKAPEGEPIALATPPLILMTPGGISGHLAKKKELLKQRDKVDAQIAANEAAAALLQGKEDKKSKARLEQLQKEHEALAKKREGLDAQLAKIPLGDDDKYDPARVLAARDANKTVLKRALLRGPVLLNMTLSGHFILLIGYRDRNLYIVDPGKVIHKQWFGHAEDPATLPAQVFVDNNNIVIIDGETEFAEVGADKLKLAFLDNLMGCESFFFASIGDQPSYNAVAPLAARAVVEADVRRFPKPKEPKKPKEGAAPAAPAAP